MIRIGRVAGLPVLVHWTTVVVVAFVGWSVSDARLREAAPGASDEVRAVAGLLAGVLLLVGILAHELGHAVMARRHGMAVEDVKLWLLGGATTLRAEAPSPAAEYRVAVVGPAVSATLAAGAAGAAEVIESVAGTGLTVGLLRWLAWTNLLLAGFNALPAVPLDGGRVLQAALWARWADRLRAARVTATVGRAFGQGLVFVGLVLVVAEEGAVRGVWLALVGWVLSAGASSEGRRATVRERLEGRVVQEVMCPAESVQGWLNLRDFMEEHVSAGGPVVTYLVSRPDGRLTGVLDLHAVLDVPEEEWPAVAVRSVARPIEEVLHVTCDEAVAEVVDRLNLAAGESSAVVAEGDDIRGVFDESSLRAVLKEP